jgi:predicted RNase H-like nuclease
MSRIDGHWIAGVDGCRSGWLAVLRDLSGEAPPRLAHFSRFAEILQVPEQPDPIAVDMPIGLPERIDGPGRAPEQHVRPLLGPRQSSVFSIPARAAVMCEDYREACRLAAEHSDPPKRVSKQAFNIFPKIRELDALMTPERASRIFEVHPEVAFWRLNGGSPMALPKKVRSRANPDGLAERRKLLQRHGYTPAFLTQATPRGAGADDLLDAAVCALIAGRLARGEARPMPDPPARDARGLAVAIWS